MDEHQKGRIEELLSETQATNIVNILVGHDLNFLCSYSGNDPMIMRRFAELLKQTVKDFISQQIPEDSELDFELDKMKYLYQELWGMCNDFRCSTAVKFMHQKPSGLIKATNKDVLKFKKKGIPDDHSKR